MILRSTLWTDLIRCYFCNYCNLLQKRVKKGQKRTIETSRQVTKVTNVHAAMLQVTKVGNKTGNTQFFLPAKIHVIKPVNAAA